MKAHAARALHQRLDHDAGDFTGMRSQHGIERGLRFLVARQVGDDVAGGKEIAIGAVHGGIGDRHGGEGVAVIAAAEGDEAAAAFHSRD